MAPFRRAGTERVNAFRVGDSYLFKHYFEGDEVFSRLKRYYDEYEYRFEVPADRFEGLRAFLDDHGYALVVVEAIEEFAVVKRKYTEHPQVLFRESVFHRSLGNFNCFVMKDEDAVDRAVSAGATALSDTGMELTV